MKHTMILETARLQMREMNLSDINALSSILQDENVMYAYNGAFNAEETMEWMMKQMLRYKEYGFGLWGLFLKDTDEMIGQCGITMQEYKTAKVPEIGYLLAYRHWHNGYATEAAIACREYGNQHPPFQSIIFYHSGHEYRFTESGTTYRNDSCRLYNKTLSGSRHASHRIPHRIKYHTI